MPSPSASYSVTLRCAITNVPGAFARVATAIGAAGGDLGAIDIVRHGILQKNNATEKVAAVTAARNDSLMVGLSSLNIPETKNGPERRKA